MALGCTLPPPSPLPFPRIPFIFLLAAHYHPSLIALSSIRKSLPIRTVFNILGPLINPAQPRGMLLGVNSPDLGPIFIEALKELGVKRAMVVCGHEHLDEISIAGDTWAWSLDEEGEIKSLNLHPSQFGLPVHPLSEVKSSTPSENAALLTAMLTSTDPPPLPDGSSYDGIRNFILLNAAALLALAGIAKSFEDGVELARRSISEGRAWAALDAFRSMGAVQPDNIIPTKKASEPM
jgi:anthranilate phosphoribosyltransferase